MHKHSARFKSIVRVHWIKQFKGLNYTKLLLQSFAKCTQARKLISSFPSTAIWNNEKPNKKQ